MLTFDQKRSDIIFPINHNNLLTHSRYFKESCSMYNILDYYSKHICAQVQKHEKEKHRILCIQPNHNKDVVIAVKNPEIHELT